MNNIFPHLRPLSDEEIALALRDLPGWSQEKQALVCTINFQSFDDAICFMMHSASEADVLDHYPEWSNFKQRVDIRLTTHATDNRITRLDVELARRMQKFLPECRLK